MMKKLKLLILSIFDSFPFLKNALKIFLDKRYLYHYLQGLFTSNTSRQVLKKLELFFYRERVDIYKKSTYPESKYKNELSNDGVVENPIYISRDKAQEIKNYLSHKLCHDPEDRNSQYFKISDASSNIKKAYYMCEDVVRAPYVLEIANDITLLNYVTEFFGALPSVDYIGAWWSLPNENLSLTQSYHRDIDTLHSLKFFVYLTDVDENSGPHMYLEGSSNSNFVSTKDRMHTDEEVLESFSADTLRYLIGPMGHCFLADTFGLHKGLLPKNAPRLVLQIIYSIKRTPFGPKKPFLSSAGVKNINLNTPSSVIVNKNIVNWKR